MLIDFPLSILIVDDHELFRNAIRDVLKDCSSRIKVADAADGVQCLSALKKKRYDLVLLDINMPVMNGLECIQEIKKRWPKQNVVVLSQYDQAGFLKQMTEYGACGYILKSAKPSDITDTIFSILIENRDQFPKSMEDTLKEIQELLSSRELEIISLICDGNRNHEIAMILGLSEYTISNHRCTILEKLQLRNSAELVKWTMKQGFTSKLEY